MQCFKTSRRREVVWMGVLVLLAGSATPVHAAWCNVFQVTCFPHCRKTQTAVSYYYATSRRPLRSVIMPPPHAPQPCAPVCTTRYVQRCYYQPVVSYQTRSYYEPVTTYRTSYYYEPVASYRYSCYYDACSCSYQQVACPTTSYQLRSQTCAVQSWVQRCTTVPVTTYQQASYWEPVTTCSAPPASPCCTPPAAPSPIADCAPVPAAPPATQPPPTATEPRIPAPPGVTENPGRTGTRQFAVPLLPEPRPHATRFRKLLSAAATQWLRAAAADAPAAVAERASRSDCGCPDGAGRGPGGSPGQLSLGRCAIALRQRGPGNAAAGDCGRQYGPLPAVSGFWCLARVPARDRRQADLPAQDRASGP